MAALTDLSNVVNLLTGGGAVAPEHIPVFKDNRIAAAAGPAAIAGAWHSFQLNEGSPSHGNTPGAAAIPGPGTVGGMMHTDPSGGRQKWLLGFEGCSGSNGVLMLYDRLLACGGLDGTITTVQQVQSGTAGARTPALNRYTGADSEGNLVFAEIYVQIGGTATTAVINYRNQAGVEAVSPAFAIGGTGLRELGRMIPINLASGDTGVREVQDVDLLATTGTAGNFGITVARPLLMIPLATNVIGGVRDALTGPLPTIPEIKTGACLCWALLPGTILSPSFAGILHMVEK